MKIYIILFDFIKKFQPYSFYILLTIFLFTSVLEAIGISLVMPLIAIVLDDNFLIMLNNSRFGSYAPDFIYDLSRSEALQLFSFLLIGSYFIKNLILIFSEYLKGIFINKIKSNLTNSLMEKYIGQNYIFHSTKNNSEISSIINEKVNHFGDGLVGSVIIIFSELIIILGLFLLIIFFRQLDTFLILLLLFSSGILTAKIVNYFVKKIGNQRQSKINEKFINFTNIINNFREIILTGRFNIYLKNFETSNNIVAKLDSIRASLQRTPQLVFETVGIVGLVLIIYYLTSVNSSTTKIITVCTFFAAISYRAIPSLHKIFYFQFNLKYYMPILIELSREFQNVKNIIFHNEKFNKFENLELNEISFDYDKENKTVLKNINLKIQKNTSIGIFGQSGSGKTTLLDIISCLIEPTKGEILVNGEKIINPHMRRKFQNNISYTSQKTTIINDTLKANICFGFEKEKIDIERYLEAVNLVDLGQLDENFKNKKMLISDQGGNISGGQLQRIGIARALYQNKDILIFDESTNALDENLEKKILSKLNNLKNKKTLIFVSHNINSLMNLDHVYEVSKMEIIKIK